MKKLMQSFVLTVMLVTLTACGGSNSSGGGGGGGSTAAPAPIGFGPGGTGATAYNVSAQIEQSLQVIRSEHFCVEVQQRSIVQIPLPQVIGSVGSTYVGVSTYGDIAYVFNQGGQSIMTVELCERAALQGGGQRTGQLLGIPVLNRNLFGCPVDEITDADIVLYGGMVGEIPVGFSPIHIPGTDRFSSLCQGGNIYY